jgi:RNA polymerase sigma-70 factor, ECF subfamily
MLIERPDSDAALDAGELVRRAQEGCVDSFAALVHIYRPRVIAFLSSRCGVGSHEAEDLAQEAFARAHQRLDEFDPRYQFSTWIHTIARRAAIDRARQRARRPQHVSLAETEIEPAHAANDPTAIVEQREEAGNIWRLARAVLTEPQFTATWLRFAESCEVEEIARRMGRSRIGVRVLLHRARVILVRESARRTAHEEARQTARRER